MSKQTFFVLLAGIYFVGMFTLSYFKDQKPWQNAEERVGINPTDSLIADETWWIMPKDDSHGLSLIFTVNEFYREQLDDFQGIDLIGEDTLEKETVTWFRIKDTTLTGPSIIHTIEERTKPHTCSDTTHVKCDGTCECDGLGCP